MSTGSDLFFKQETEMRRRIRKSLIQYNRISSNPFYFFGFVGISLSSLFILATKISVESIPRLSFKYINLKKSMSIILLNR